MSELRGERLVLRATAPDDTPALLRIHAAPEVAAWWGRPERGFPLADDPAATRFTVWVAGEITGLIQFGEEADPDYRHAWIDIFLAPDRHNQGLGTEAVSALARHLVRERGHHRITIDPATENRAAIRCYEKAGFDRVGVMRRAWRDPSGAWRDVLLMELLAPVTQPAR
jgi:aminoglycoside 6'-N-acetyltransferase